MATKLTVKDVRRIIKEELANEPHRMEQEMADFIVESWLDLTDENILLENTYQLLVGTVSAKDMLLPTRYEDVPAFAKNITDNVLEGLRSYVQGVAKQLLESAMEPTDFK
jgi:hypothetical protein